MAFVLRKFSLIKTVTRIRPGPLDTRKILTRFKTDLRTRLKERERRLGDGYVKTDTVIFTNDNVKFYRLLSYFGVLQVLFWVHTASTSIFLKNDTALEQMDKEKLPWFAKINLGSKAFRITFSLLSLSMGGVILFVCLKVPQQAVKSLMLRDSGRMVTIETFGSFGRPRSFTVPVEHVTCKHSRAETVSSVSMKVKGNLFFYLVDSKKGTFHDEKLFDFSVGVKRTF